MSDRRDIYLRRIRVEHARLVKFAQVDTWFKSTWLAVHAPASAEPDAVLENVTQRRNLLPASIDPSVPSFTTFTAPELVPGAVPSDGCLVLPEYLDLCRDFTAWLDPNRRAASFEPSRTDCACSDSSGLFEVPAVGAPQSAERHYPDFFLPRAFHVYGSRGVGKSIALYYVLLRRTLLHQPTVFVTKNRTFYVCEDGVFELHDLDFSEYDILIDEDPRALLFDSADASNPNMLWTHQRTLPIMEARSPGGFKDAWSYYVTGDVVVWWYRPPCRLHALAAAALHLGDSEVNDDNLNQCDEAYIRWGPLISELVRVLNDRDGEAPDFTPEQLRKVLAAKDKEDWLLTANFTHPINFSNDAALLGCGHTRCNVRVTLLSQYLWSVLPESDGGDPAGSILPRGTGLM